MVSVVLAGCSRVVGLAGGFGCGVKCLRLKQNSLLVSLRMVSFLVLIVFKFKTIADAVEVVVVVAMMKVEAVHWDRKLDFDHLDDKKIY
nr:hypothetical protein [Tanacetum cinerariifolium]